MQQRSPHTSRISILSSCLLVISYQIKSLTMLGHECHETTGQAALMILDRGNANFPYNQVPAALCCKAKKREKSNDIPDDALV